MEVLISMTRGPNRRLTRHEIGKRNAPTQDTCGPPLLRSLFVWHSCTGKRMHGSPAEHHQGDGAAERYPACASSQSLLRRRARIVGHHGARALACVCSRKRCRKSLPCGRLMTHQRTLREARRDSYRVAHFRRGLPLEVTTFAFRSPSHIFELSDRAGRETFPLCAPSAPCRGSCGRAPP